MFLSNLQLTNEQIAQKEEDFQILLLNSTEADKTYKELRDFFANTNQLDIKKYWYSYWRWYVWLTWDRLNSLSKDELVNIAFGNQLPMALLIGVDVWRSLMWYFATNNYLEDDVDSIYIKVKKSFLESGAVVGSWKGGNVTVAELVTEIRAVSKRNNSLEQAEFESKLKQIMFPNDPLVQKYATEDSDEAVRRFVDLVVFFDTVNEKDIWRVVDNFLNPEKYQNVVPGEAVVALTPALEVTQTPIMVQPAPQPSVTPPKKEEVKSTPPLVPLAPPKPTPAQIKSQIEKEFSAEDVEGMMGKLNEMAEKNNDPKIAEMYYFDETENKFKWNV